MCAPPPENKSRDGIDIFNIDRRGDVAEYHHEIPVEVQGQDPLEILRNHWGQMPDWLADVNTPDLENSDQFRRAMDQFLKERVAFYPGAGMDGQLFSLFGKSRRVRCFVHADLDVSARSVLANLQGDGPERVRGYDPVVHRIIPPEWWELDPPPKSNWESNLNESLFVILKRQDGLPEDHGSEYLGFLHVSIDAFWLYWNLWGKRKLKPYAVLLQDSGIFNGCLGGEDSRLYHMAHRAGLPEFLLVSKNTAPWPTYNVVSDWSAPAGVNRHKRCLYRRPT
jgi:hypothetical protein